MQHVERKIGLPAKMSLPSLGTFLKHSQRVSVHPLHTFHHHATEIRRDSLTWREKVRSTWSTLNPPLETAAEPSPCVMYIHVYYYYIIIICNKQSSPLLTLVLSYVSVSCWTRWQHMWLKAYLPTSHMSNVCFQYAGLKNHPSFVSILCVTSSQPQHSNHGEQVDIHTYEALR